MNAWQSSSQRGHSCKVYKTIEIIVTKYSGWVSCLRFPAIFFSSSKKNMRYYFKIDHDRFFPYTSQFIIHNHLVDLFYITCVADMVSLNKLRNKMKSIIFWDVTPCSLLSFNRRFGGTYRLQLHGRRNNFSKNQQVNRWQAPATQQTTRRHIPEDDTLHNHRCENLKSYKKQNALMWTIFRLGFKQHDYSLLIIT
jgi:hypothetical protein